MNIHTIAENLHKTIANKEALLASVQEKAKLKLGNIDAYVTGATIGFLEINIDELKRILQDVNEVINDQECDRIERDLNT